MLPPPGCTIRHLSAVTPTFVDAHRLHSLKSGAQKDSVRVSGCSTVHATWLTGPAARNTFASPRGG
jgi:hypothetical protein